jgi:hypothetical protein
MEERRRKLRRNDDVVISNGWKEQQALVLQTIKDLKEGMKEFKEAIEEIKGTIHSTPCPTARSTNTKIDTAKWFVGPILLATVAGVIAILFKVFQGGGVQ